MNSEGKQVESKPDFQPLMLEARLIQLIDEGVTTGIETELLNNP